MNVLNKDDANLIGASRELFNALKDLMAAEGGEPGEYDDLRMNLTARVAWKQAEDAIAKAEGREGK